MTKKKQAHRFKEQTNGYQWGEGSEEGQDSGIWLGGTNYYYKINTAQGYIVHHREYSQYFIIAINWLYLSEIVNHCFIPDIYCESTLPHF